MNIKQIDGNSSKVDEFEKTEWHLADIEHYGKPIDFKKKKYKFLAESDSGEITGTLDLIIEVNLAFIESLIVGSKFRRIGVGKKLLQAAENLARDKQCTKIWLETNLGWSAEAFYEKNGYEVTGVHEKHIMNQKTLIFTKFF
jgi:ribosomal protein S18 acetylase RimI-like enzyme